MSKFVCVVCPNGCEVEIDETTLEVSGNKCPKGKQFAIDELTNPKRTICSTVKTIFEDCPVVPVRVDKEIPKDKIFAVMKEINKVQITDRLGIGDVVISDVLNLNVDVIITSNVLKESL